MRYTAIIHLESPASAAWGELRGALDAVPGVESVGCEAADGLVVVGFEDRRASLAQLVRQIEDAGSRVSGVAQRPNRRPPIVVTARTGAPVV